MKVNGIRTAVKAGELTPQEALAKIKAWNKGTPNLVPVRTVKWLLNRLDGGDRTAAKSAFYKFVYGG